MLVEKPLLLPLILFTTLPTALVHATPGYCAEIIGRAVGSKRAVVRKLRRIDPTMLGMKFLRVELMFKEESDLLRNPDYHHAKQSLEPAIRGKTNRITNRLCKHE